MRYCINSNIGIVRSENQDRGDIAWNEKWTLAMLCDGMGGHYGGAKCADLTINLLKKYFNDSFLVDTAFDDKNKIIDWFNAALSFIKENLIKFANQNPEFKSMGTTLTTCLIFNANRMVYVFNIGDSRTYVYNGLLHQITKDQNLYNQMISQKILDTDLASKHPDANKLVSCIGPSTIIRYDNYIIRPSSNIKYIILSSDGLHDYVDKPVIEQVIQDVKKTLEEKTKLLIEYAKRNLSKDNITIMIVELNDDEKRIG
ncbi:serine/threonine-protein phosphatase [[Mycoplasma] phocae]|uniref:Serine/threonine-protein phosphatase n=1 Tax=[Mycoplasma] phocae TaxID=142651 RepID=A0A2Z5IQP8_9BACT|nr:protein phosphatase 2C domain-containing protein [[Mycoplasma] phocae]AXE61050.1 serine/threonine-protein phosphatase [[Mycoplasma] phocae]